MAALHEHLLELTCSESTALYNIFLAINSDYIEENYSTETFVSDSIFLNNYSKCMIEFLTYLLENKYADS